MVERLCTISSAQTRRARGLAAFQITLIQNWRDWDKLERTEILEFQDRTTRIDTVSLGPGHTRGPGRRALSLSLSLRVVALVCVGKKREIGAARGGPDVDDLFDGRAVGAKQRVHAQRGARRADPRRSLRGGETSSSRARRETRFEAARASRSLSLSLAETRAFARRAGSSRRERERDSAFLFGARHQRGRLERGLSFSSLFLQKRSRFREDEHDLVLLVRAYPRRRPPTTVFWNCVESCLSDARAVETRVTTQSSQTTRRRVLSVALQED